MTWMGELDYRNQAAAILMSAFSVLTTGGLLWELTQLKDDQLGDLKTDKGSLVTGLLLTCLFLSINIGNSYYILHKSAATAKASASNAADKSQANGGGAAASPAAFYGS